MRIPAFALALTAAFCLTLASFAQAQYLNLPQYENGVNLYSFQQADINNDGKADIIGTPTLVNGSPGTSIVVLLANGTGGFGAPIITAISGVDSPGEQVVADFNGDGFPDVAVFGKDHVTGLNAVAVMLGNGNGTFKAGVETVLATIGTVQFGNCPAAAGDYNGDGKLDLAYLSNNAGVVSLNVALGKDNGTFSAPTSSTLTTALQCLAPGDFNNDKKLDLVAATSGGNIYMLLGEGNGSFESPLLVGKGGNKIIPAELTTNGNLDLVASQFDSPPSVTVLLGDGTGHFPTRTTYVGQGTELVAPVAVQDLNGDGLPDLAFLTSTNKAPILNTFLNNGSGSFTQGKTYNGDGWIPVSVPGLYAADLNGDDKIDFAFGNSAGGISVLLGNGDGTFKGNYALSAFGLSAQVAVLTSNGRPDLVLGSLILFSNGDGTFSAQTNSCSSGSIAIGDYTNNGKLDFAVLDTFDDLPVVDVCLGNGNGTFAAPAGNSDEGVQHGIIVAADFNNDGKLDLAASDENGISILLGNGNGTFQKGIATATAESFPNFVVADFNNDGKLDIATSTTSGVAVYLGNGDGTFKLPLVTPGPFGTLSVADLNKDGKRDLIMAKNGPVTVFLGKGDGTFEAPVSYTVPGSVSTRAVIGDFNLDGNLDVAVGTLNNGVAILFGNGAGKLSAPTDFRAGNGVQVLATSDFNGDKKPDLAVVLGDGYVVTLLHQ